MCVAVGKPFLNTHDALIFPHFDRVRIKALNRLPDGRFVAELKGVPRRRLQHGTLIIAGSEPVVRSRVGYGISLRTIPAGVYQARGGAYREHALPGTLTVTPVSPGYRITASADLPMIPGASYRLLPVEAGAAAARSPAASGSPQPGQGTAEAAKEGGSKRKLPHELLLCIPVEPGRKRREAVGSALSQLRGTVSARRIAAANLGLLGWTLLPERIGLPSVEEELRRLDSPIGEREGDEVLELKGSSGPRVALFASFLEKVAAEIERTLRKAGGEKIDAVSRRTDHPIELVRAVSEELERTEHVVREAGVLIPAGPRAGLSPIEKGVLESLRSGFETKGLVRAGKGIERRVLDKLVEIRLAVRIGDRYCAMDVFETLIGRLLRGRNPGEAIELAQAREILGLPREHTVQLLELLDREGLLRREQHVHRVVRGPGSKR